MSDVKKIAEKFLDQIEIAPKWADTFQCDFNEMEQLAQAYLELEQKLSAAREALEFYANEQTWTMKAHVTSHPLEMRNVEVQMSPALFQKGLPALEALAALGKE